MVRLVDSVGVPHLAGAIERFFVYVDYACSGVVTKAFYVGKGTRHRVENVTKARNSLHTRIANSADRWYRITVNRTNDEQEAFNLERQLIRHLETRDHQGGANKTDGGDGTRAVHVSAATRAKLAARPFAQSQAFREKMSTIHKGRPKSEEWRKNIAKARSGQRPSTEAVTKMARAQTGKSLSEEHRARLSASGRGKPKTAAHRAKIAAALKGRKLSPEHLAKTRRKPSPQSPHHMAHGFEAPNGVGVGLPRDLGCIVDPADLQLLDVAHRGVEDEVDATLFPVGSLHDDTSGLQKRRKI